MIKKIKSTIITWKIFTQIMIIILLAVIMTIFNLKIWPTFFCYLIGYYMYAVEHVYFNKKK